MIKIILIIIGVLFSLLICFLTWCCCKVSSIVDEEISEMFEEANKDNS